MIVLAQQGAYVLFTRGAAALAAFALTVVVARTLGADGSGIYYLAVSVGSIVAVIGRAGLDTAVLRFVAEAVDAGNAAEAATHYRRGLAVSLGWSAALATGVAVAAPQLSSLLGDGDQASRAIRAAALLVPIQSALLIHLQVMNAVRRPVMGSAVTLVLPPALSAFLIWSWGSLAPASAILISAASGGLGTVIAAAVLHRMLPNVSATTERSLGDLLRIAGPLLVVGSAVVVMQWTDILVLGIFKDPSDVGVYAPAVRVSLLLSLVLVALNSIVSPQVAGLVRRGESAMLETLMRQSATVGIAIAAPLAAITIILAPQIMGIFGAEFARAATAVRILAVGQLINVGTGAVGYALSVTGFEKVLQRSSLVVATINLVLNLALVPSFGIEGAAVATAVSLASMSGLNTWWVRKELGVQPLPLLPSAFGGRDGTRR